MKRGTKIRIVLLLVVGAVAASLFFGERAGPSIEPGSTLVIELEGAYVEAPNAPFLARALGEARRPFVGVLSRFAMAARDERIETVVVVIRPLGVGWGKAEELRGAITRLGESGRRTIAYLDLAAFGASREYFVASAADTVYIVPGGSLPVVGLAAEYFFLGGLWQHLGIEFEVGKAGKYKSAVEAYAGTGMSDPSREMATSLLDAAFDRYVDAIAEGRGLARQEVLEAIDRGPMLPAELEANKLVDGSMHLDALLDSLEGEIVQPEDYAGVQPADVGFEPVAEVALIYASGNVVQGRDNGRGGPVMASRTLSRAILDAAEDASIDALILRVDSPGGSALASDEIWRAVERAREHDKPIIASFSDVAASGGYYVAAGADKIVSNGGTLTGSIGVFALRPVLGGALEKLGINVESLSRGRYAEFLLGSEPLSEGARRRLQGMVLETYGLFLERVAAGRSLTVEAVDGVAQGRVWTGRQAQAAGLVDRIGGLHDAVDEVRRALELDPDADVALVPYPAPRSLGEQLASALEGRVTAVARASLPLPAAMRQLESWFAELPTDSPLAVPPVLVDIH